MQPLIKIIQKNLVTDGVGIMFWSQFKSGQDLWFNFIVSGLWLQSRGSNCHDPVFSENLPPTSTFPNFPPTNLHQRLYFQLQYGYVWEYLCFQLPSYGHFGVCIFRCVFTIHFYGCGLHTQMGVGPQYSKNILLQPQLKVSHFWLWIPFGTLIMGASLSREI